MSEHRKRQESEPRTATTWLKTTVLLVCLGLLVVVVVRDGPAGAPVAIALVSLLAAGFGIDTLRKGE